MKITTKKLILSSTIASIVASAGTGDDYKNLDQLNFAYSGDQSRIGVGISEEGKFVGDFLRSFNNSYRSNWMTQGWYSNGAGGLELDYHWIPEVQSEKDLLTDENFKVSKLFIALDQNTFDDRKLTIGGGRESQDKFWNAYTSFALTGRRLISNTSFFTQDVLNGFLGNHATTQIRTVEDITRIYEHPYEWGVGARYGKYFDSNLVRLTGGLDYEMGKFSSDQLTASADLEKYFANTGHSVALHVEQVQKNGDFVVDKSDTRASILYRYDFGRTYQPTVKFEEVKVVDEDALARLKEQRKSVIQNKIDLSSMAFFNLDSAILREDALGILKDVATKIKSHNLGSKINIVGHTCALGTKTHNQSLSEKRALAARDFLASQGIEIAEMNAIGKGELEPAFDNKGPDIAKNRRVAISFLTIENDYQEAEILPEEVPVKWVKQKIKTPPSWLARALRNPAKHKKTVDVYQFQETESKTTLGAVVVLNEIPVAVDDSLSILRNSSATLIDVLANDSDPEDDTLTIVDTTQPTNGSVVNNGTSVTYTPNTGYIGTDTFDYTIDDGNGDQALATVTITVENNAPNAINDTISVFRNSVDNSIDVLNNDSDVEDETLSIIAVDQPNNGNVTIDGATILYTPNQGYIGTDTFNYTIEDESGSQTTAVVTVNILNNAPNAIDDEISVFRNSPATIIDVLSNDTDIDLVENLNIAQVTQASNGTVVNNGNNLSYTPNTGFVGTDVFTYTIEDENGEAATAQVTVRVLDNAPVAVNDNITIFRNSPATTIDVLNNDSSPTNDTISISDVDIAINGTIINNGQSLSYTPNTGFIGVETIQYTIDNGNGSQTSAILTITVINNAPNAIDDSYTLFTNSTDNTLDVLLNDSDIDSDVSLLIISSFVQAQNGTVVNNGTSLSYTPNPNFVGTDTFTYINQDADGDQASATVLITIENSTPSAVDDEITVFRNSGTTQINPLENDSDPENDPLTISQVSEPTNGTASTDGAIVSYTPNTGFIGEDIFRYNITDSNGTQSTATIKVTVLNNLPNAIDDEVDVISGISKIIEVLGNDTDIDGTNLSVRLVGDPQNGSVTINSDGTVTYQSSIGYVGRDSFSYTIEDEDGGQSNARVRINVLPANAAPIALDDLYLVSYQGARDFNPLENDSDPDGDVIKLESVDTTTLRGTLEVDANGMMHYQAPILFSGNDVFTYRISDGNGGFATATVIMCVND